MCPGGIKQLEEESSGREGGVMARDTKCTWVCDNCGHKVTGSNLVMPPVGWYTLSGFRVSLELCSLNCLNEVAQAWVKNSIAVEKE